MNVKIEFSSLWGIVQMVLILLKLLGKISWGWEWVLMPLWIALVLFVLLVLIVCVIKGLEQSGW